VRRRNPPAVPKPLVVLVALLAVAGAACSKSATNAKPAGPGTTAAPTIFPLTGRPITDQAKAARPAVAVKIDNSADARPQAGVDKADVVYEEFTEGITRFVVVFQSSDADPVGPVRSVRPADPLIVAPLGGVFAFSGGSGAVLALVPQAHATVVDETAADVMRRRPRRGVAYEHTLYSSTTGLSTKAPAGAKPPPRFADFLAAGQPFAAPGGVPVTHVAFTPAPGLRADYDWDAASGAWKRGTDGTPATLEGGGQIAPNNVIVQFTPYSVFPPDPKVLYPEVVGSGEAWFFASGMLAKGRWSKANPAAVTAFTDANGAPVVLPPGQTWVHLVAPGSPVATR
jgi:hypothetical protein